MADACAEEAGGKYESARICGGDRETFTHMAHNDRKMNGMATTVK